MKWIEKPCPKVCSDESLHSIVTRFSYVNRSRTTREVLNLALWCKIKWKLSYWYHCVRYRYWERKVGAVTYFKRTKRFGI